MLYEAWCTIVLAFFHDSGGTRHATIYHLNTKVDILHMVHFPPPIFSRFPSQFVCFPPVFAIFYCFCFFTPPFPFSYFSPRFFEKVHFPSQLQVIANVKYLFLNASPIMAKIKRLLSTKLHITLYSLVLYCPHLLEESAVILFTCNSYIRS